jgi:phosphohistidine phosphatase SixA
MKMIIRKLTLILSLSMLVSCSSLIITDSYPILNTTAFDAQYYLVRHAEKTTEKVDPDLTELGRQRAKDLADRLKGVPLTHIYSSNFKRTINTAKPVSNNKNLEILLYNPKDLAGLSKELLSKEGIFLVVGHSNTTPDLSKFMGGIAGEPIIEATEYNRLYILKRKGNAISSEIVVYGK